MQLTDYTTYDQIRAVLSVTDMELEDETLALPIFYTELLEKLREIGTGVETLYTTYHEAGTTSLTADQKRFYNLTQVFAAYAVCMQLINSLELLAVKKEQDARAQYERFEKPFERVEASVRAAFAVASARLAGAFNAVAATPVTVPSATRSMVATASPAYDPVTG